MLAVKSMQHVWYVQQCNLGMLNRLRSVWGVEYWQRLDGSRFT